MNDIINNKDVANAASMNAGNLGSERQIMWGAQQRGYTVVAPQIPEKVLQQPIYIVKMKKKSRGRLTLVIYASAIIRGFLPNNKSGQWSKGARPSQS